MYAGKGNTGQVYKNGRKPRRKHIDPETQALFILESIESRIAEGRDWSIDEYLPADNQDVRPWLLVKLEARGL